MREVKKYRKRQGTRKQRARLTAINKLEDDIAKYYFNYKRKNKN